jgi:hypothetical protein
LIALEGNLFDPKNLDTVPGYEASSTVSFLLHLLRYLLSSVPLLFLLSIVLGKQLGTRIKKTKFSAFVGSVADPESGAL